MKKLFLLTAAVLFANLCSYSQKGEKKFSFAIVENVLPFADFDYESTTNSFDNSKLLFNYIPSFEVGFDNTYFASLRFKALMMDEGVNEQDVFTMTATGHATFIREHSGYSTSIILGYNFTNRSQVHRFTTGVVLGWVHVKTEYVALPTQTGDYFQWGAELAYKYFLSVTNYRFGFGASFEISYAKDYNKDPYINIANLSLIYRF